MAQAGDLLDWRHPTTLVGSDPTDRRRVGTFLRVGIVVGALVKRTIVRKSLSMSTQMLVAPLVLCSTRILGSNEETKDGTSRQLLH
jgi:hypothetical protein